MLPTEYIDWSSVLIEPRVSQLDDVTWVKQLIKDSALGLENILRIIEMV